MSKRGVADIQIEKNTIRLIKHQDGVVLGKTFVWFRGNSAVSQHHRIEYAKPVDWNELMPAGWEGGLENFKIGSKIILFRDLVPFLTGERSGYLAQDMHESYFNWQRKYDLAIRFCNSAQFLDDLKPKSFGNVNQGIEAEHRIEALVLEWKSRAGGLGQSKA